MIAKSWVPEGGKYNKRFSLYDSSEGSIDRVIALVVKQHPVKDEWNYFVSTQYGGDSEIHGPASFEFAIQKCEEVYDAYLERTGAEL